MDSAVSRCVHGNMAGCSQPAEMQQHADSPVQVLVLCIAQRQDGLRTEALQASQLLLHWEVG